jgi:protein-disulfide isomerase
MPEIRKAYIDTGKVRYVLKDFPLPFHANAQKAAEAARCAGAQGAYWEMHDQIFQSQAQWSGEEQQQVLDTFVGYAESLDLDPETFRGCLESGQTAAQIRADLLEGQQAGVGGTPSFLINGQLVVGALPFESFRQVIEAELSKSE